MVDAYYRYPLHNCDMRGWFYILSHPVIVTKLGSALLGAQIPLYLHPRLYIP